MTYRFSPAHTRSASRTRHQAICADCGISTTLPFRPSRGKPAYCRPCFNLRRHGLPPMVISTNGGKSSTASQPAVDSAPSSVPVFSGMPLKAATKTVISRMNISSPTPIQEKAIPHLMAGRDLIGQARTGSGKTLAFAAPLVERCDPSLPKVQALVLLPTRELAMQVAGVVEALASAQQVRVTLLYGGRSLRPEYAALRNGAHIVVGTPGRTLDHLRQGDP